MKELSKIDAELESRIIDVISAGNEHDDNKEFKRSN